MDETLRWIHGLLTGVMVDAFERLKDLDSTDTCRRQEARAALAWIMADDREHPLTYLVACDVLELCPKYGRRFARKLARKAQSVESRVTLYSRAG